MVGVTRGSVDCLKVILFFGGPVSIVGFTMTFEEVAWEGSTSRTLMGSFVHSSPIRMREFTFIVSVLILASRW